MSNRALGTDQSMPAYEFGKNWAQFVKSSYSEERLKISVDHLLSFLRVDSLEGRTFIDVGCGSGIHSLAAHRAGAKSIVSLDVDQDSVATTRALWKQEGRPDSWQVMEGSALDAGFLSTLEPADVLYSWGVLHHTGDMWQALRNVTTLMKPGGVFYTALYTTTHKTPYWLRVKRRYNNAGRWGRYWMELRFLVRHQILMDLVHRRNTYKFIRNYKKSRGMEFMTNVRDWLGGYPYEDCSPDEFVDFAYNELQLNLVRITTGEACSEYLLERRP